MFYRVQRRVVYLSYDQNTVEAWGIDRDASGLCVTSTRFTDTDDPLAQDCSLLLLFRDGRYVTWPLMFEWLSEAEEAGYTLVSGFNKLSPYSTLIIRGP